MNVSDHSTTRPSSGTKHYVSKVRLAGGDHWFRCPAGAHILPHEHLLLNLEPWWEGEEPFESVVIDAGLTEDSLEAAAQRPLEVIRENLILSDWVMLARELRDAVHAGVALVVDLTSEGLEPDRQHALAAAKAAGVELVVGLGHYREPYPPRTAGESAEERSSRWLDSWRAGFDDGTFPGILGEIGTSAVISHSERDSLIASAVVSSETNAAISVHVEPFSPTEEEIVTVLENAGATRERIVLSHCDLDLKEDRLRAVLDLGTYVEFDQFGFASEGFVRDQRIPSDSDRIAAIGKLIEWGGRDRILLSHDVCTRTQWIRFGGGGYRHIGAVIRGQLLREFGSETVDQLLTINPLRMLSGTNPRVIE